MSKDLNSQLLFSPEVVLGAAGLVHQAAHSLFMFRGCVRQRAGAPAERRRERGLQTPFINIFCYLERSFVVAPPAAFFSCRLRMTTLNRL